MPMELLKVVSQIFELDFFSFFLLLLKIKIPPMTPGVILHRSNIMLFPINPIRVESLECSRDTIYIYPSWFNPIHHHRPQEPTLFLSLSLSLSAFPFNLRG